MVQGHSVDCSYRFKSPQVVLKFLSTYIRQIAIKNEISHIFQCVPIAEYSQLKFRTLSGKCCNGDRNNP
eukprot:gene11184-7957_t